MREIRIFIAGLGHVGRAVLALLSESSSPRVLIAGVADSSGAVCFNEELSPDGAWKNAVIAAKKKGLRLAELDLAAVFGAACLSSMQVFLLPKPILSSP